MNKCVLVLAIFPFLLACRATDDKPIVDMQGVNIAQYNTDLTQCQSYADQVESGRQVARGAVGGAVIGGAVGAAVGNSRTVQRSAGAGAVLGTARGSARAIRERDQVVHNCLRGRGYRVLN